MRLKCIPFLQIARGIKTIELRLLDEKRKGIKVGDYIVFTYTEDENLTLKTEVVELSYFKNFEELYASLPLLKCGYTGETVKVANPKDMEEYYSKEEQEKYGVVGIEIKLL